MTPFNALDRATWGEFLTADQMAAIFQRSAASILKASQTHSFHPARAQRYPSLWRKADVIRHLDGSARGVLRRAS